MTPEGKVKKAVKQRLDELGAYHFWPVQTGYGNATLDCLGCCQGKFFGLETKAPGEKLTARQKITALKMRDAGALVFVVDSVENAKKLLTMEKVNELSFGDVDFKT